jgi:hypothetical protein
MTFNFLGFTFICGKTRAGSAAELVELSALAYLKSAESHPKRTSVEAGLAVVRMDRHSLSSRARSSSPSFPSKARKRWLQSSDLVTFSAKGV